MFKRQGCSLRLKQMGRKVYKSFHLNSNLACGFYPLLSSLAQSFEPRKSSSMRSSVPRPACPVGRDDEAGSCPLGAATQLDAPSRQSN